MVTNPASTFPTDLRPTLEVALKTIIFAIHLLAGGTQQRTYLAETGEGFWVVRLEAAPGVQLQRGLAAQQQAQRVGFPTPTLVANAHTFTDHGDYFWSIEEFVHGVEFDPPSVDVTIHPVIGRHVGEQLRKLHQITLPAFGLLPPAATDQTPTLALWLANRQAQVEQALPLVAGLPNLPQQLTAAFATLHTYTGAPHLCHGDFAGTNILVNDTHLVAAVDWEWAQGADPALDFGWWYFWHDDRPTLAAMIEGYAPADPAAFTQRALAFALIHALETLSLYQQAADAKGVRYCQEKLHQYCR
ncbi:MAG: aminoglycoside phosphotransferase family protein [Caldilineaceae bacterium]|nr:aminoglycoside phosphotransferase family protein [Caldilineaceae bacterium]